MLSSKLGYLLELEKPCRFEPETSLGRDLALSSRSRNTQTSFLHLNFDNVLARHNDQAHKAANHVRLGRSILLRASLALSLAFLFSGCGSKSFVDCFRGWVTVLVGSGEDDVTFLAGMKSIFWS